MAKRKGEHRSDKEQYAAYKTQGRYLKNKKAKLERHIKNNPDDVQAQEALKNIKSDTIRKTPNTYKWRSSQMWYAQKIASLGYNGNVALGGRDEAKLQEEVIGYGATQILDVPPAKRDGAPKKNKSNKGKAKKA